jgi:hypothetical protein
MVRLHPLARAGAVCTLAAIASQPAQACNIFEELFGQCRPRVVYAPQGDAPPPVEERRSFPVARNPEELKQRPLRAPDGVRTGSLAHFRADTTLRAGDVVVTPEGFRIYNGREAFAPLGRRQGSLGDLERESRRGGIAWSKAPTLKATQGADAVRRVESGAN